jgi:ABC-type amino acid transport system permease subunit
VNAPGSPSGAPIGGDPERVLSQALHAMAGGAKEARPDDPAAERANEAHLTTAQIVLIAVLLGLVIGVTAGLISLLP